MRLQVGGLTGLRVQERRTTGEKEKGCERQRETVTPLPSPIIRITTVTPVGTRVNLNALAVLQPEKVKPQPDSELALAAAIIQRQPVRGTRRHGANRSTRPLLKTTLSGYLGAVPVTCNVVQS